MTKPKKSKEIKNTDENVTPVATTPVAETPEASNSVSTKLDSVMTELKEQNPMASWKNLFLGIGVVLLVIVSSLVYFNKLAANAVVEDKTKEIEVSKPSNITKPKDEKVDTTKEDVYTTVLEGEGLWNVAERVCNNGDKYVILAEANGLGAESEVVLGQKLLVKCD